MTPATDIATTYGGRSPMTLRVMSFNIRYPEPTDGLDNWENRRGQVADVLRHYQPDIAGLQEPVIEQLRYLDEALPEYARFGVSRYGNEDEKFTAVYYRRDTVELQEAAAFWFSETPDVPASSSWLIHKPYAVNWARLRHRESGLMFALFNTHFPYKADQAEARLRSAALLRERAQQSDDCVILTGDFNSPDGGEVYQILSQEFRDARVEATERLGPTGTFHGFRGEALERRVDWILLRGPLTTERYVTITDHQQGRYPSDHFPVMAELRIDTSRQTAPPAAF